MSQENDNLRHLVLLIGDVNQCEIKLSILRNRLMDNMENIPDYAREEVPELGKTILRLNREFTDILKMLLKIS